MRARSVALLLGAVLLAGCGGTTAKEGLSNVPIGASEGPPAPTISVPSAGPNETVVWSPPAAGSVPATTIDIANWADKEAVEAPVLKIFNTDGGIGLTENDVERGPELIEALNSVRNALPYEPPITVGILSSMPLDATACESGGNTYPCAAVSWTVSSQGRVLSAPFRSVIVKDGSSWKLSARHTCAVVTYFRTPCPITFPPTPDELRLGATTTRP